jgi:hypothetical protein
MNKAVTMLSCPMFAVRLWISASPYRWPIYVFRPPVCSVLPPHCTKDVYTPQGLTRDLWTVLYCVETWWLGNALLDLYPGVTGFAYRQDHRQAWLIRHVLCSSVSV